MAYGRGSWYTCLVSSGSWERRVELTESAFELLVAEALDELPGDILAALDNVEIVVEDEPTAWQRRRVAARGDLLGLYEGVPLTLRTSAYGMVTPDRITIFRRAIVRSSRDADDLRAMVRRTVQHELAHHFGITDDRLRELDRY